MEPIYPTSSNEVSSGVWPPPPQEQFESPLLAPAIPFRKLYRRAPGKLGAKANISDLRDGAIQCDSSGLIIAGKAVPRAEIRLAIMIPLILLSLLLAAIAGIIMDYGFRRDERFGVLWGDVREICLSPSKQEACVVFNGPNYAGKIKLFSIAMRIGPGYFPQFAQSVQQFAPSIVQEGRLRNATSGILWIFLGILLATVIGTVLWLTLAPTH